MEVPDQRWLVVGNYLAGAEQIVERRWIPSGPALGPFQEEECLARRVAHFGDRGSPHSVNLAQPPHLAVVVAEVVQRHGEVGTEGRVVFGKGPVDGNGLLGGGDG